MAQLLPTTVQIRKTLGDHLPTGMSVWCLFAALCWLPAAAAAQSCNVDSLIAEYSTFWGGGGFEGSPQLELGADGSVYVVGRAESADFPVTAGAAQSTSGGGGMIIPSRNLTLRVKWCMPPTGAGVVLNLALNYNWARMAACM